MCVLVETLNLREEVHYGRGSLVHLPCERVLLLTDSKAAIQSIRKACLIGQARTRALGSLGPEIGRRTPLYGPEAAKIAWVKSHIGIPGNEGADEAAKAGAEKDPSYGGEVTEGGVKMNIREFRKVNRTELGVLYGIGILLLYIHSFGLTRVAYGPGGSILAGPHPQSAASAGRLLRLVNIFPLSAHTGQMGGS